MAKNQTSNRYSQLLEAIFERYYQTGVGEIVFERTAINQVAGEIGIKLPKNLGDIIYESGLKR
ncbi:hypothetical protein L0128_11925 [candidate division KSB1 bacterium]|nr:hypothetical protein [candidate division KSB1 bacterium]